MIIAYLIDQSLKAYTVTSENATLLKDAFWIDLLSPSKEEELMLEKHLDLDVPTREEMAEIELSSRLYKEDDAIFMTATMIAASGSLAPSYDPVTFILSKNQLITIRYIEPQSFRIYVSHLHKLRHIDINPHAVLIGLLDVVVDRIADTLEFIGKKLDEYSKNIFRPLTDNATKLDYQNLMREIGANGDLNTKTRESLMTFNRLTSFYSQALDHVVDKDNQSHLLTLSKDILSLSDHANFISTKVNFLLDATLGLVNIEQNNIIKIFSVAAVIFLPPTLIASIYGMNFHFMPELSWHYGYSVAILLMIAAAWLPYKYFKYRNWL